MLRANRSTRKTPAAVRVRAGSPDNIDLLIEPLRESEIMGVLGTDITIRSKAADHLYGATTGMRLPCDSSDRPYPDSSAMCNRYGGFAPRHKLTIFGERILTIVHSTGMRLGVLH